MKAPGELRVPGWFIATLGYLVPLLAGAVFFGGKMQHHLEETHATFVEVCRIDFYLHRERPDACPVPVFRNDRAQATAN